MGIALPTLYPTGLSARLASRRDGYAGATAGMAPGFVQANLAILPQKLAESFLQFCQRNPKPCPLIGVSAPGDPHIPALGEDLDIRTDLPRYRIWRDGVPTDEPADVTRVVARRSGHLRHRLLVFLRAGLGRKRHRASAHDLRL